MKKIKIPNVNLKESISFFKNSKFEFVYDQFVKFKDPNSSFRKNNYLPNLVDLYRLHCVIRQNKRLKILEYGSGISTAIMADALMLNKKILGILSKLKGVKISALMSQMIFKEKKKCIVT